MKVKREITTTRLKTASRLLSKYENKEDRQVQKGMKLVENNARAHIDSDVINYLTEEGMNIMVHPAYSSDCCTV